MPTLREARLEQAYSVHDLAAKAGVSNKTIIDIEHGRVVPKLRTIRRLSEALGIRPADIAEFTKSVKGN